MRDASLALSLLALLAGGCSSNGTPDMQVAHDLSAIPDLSTGGQDLAGADLATIPDMTKVYDLAGVNQVVMVGMGGLMFTPPSVNIPVGGSVAWQWATSNHSVISGTVVNFVGVPDDKFCSPSDTNCATTPVSLAGDVYIHTFAAAGDYPYFCGPHGGSGMTGNVHVQ